MYGKCFQTHSCKRLHYILLIIIDHGENTLDNHCYRAYAKKKRMKIITTTARIGIHLTWPCNLYLQKAWHVKHPLKELIWPFLLRCGAVLILLDICWSWLTVDVLRTTCVFRGTDLRVLKILSSEYGLFFPSFIWRITSTREYQAS